MSMPPARKIAGFARFSGLSYLVDKKGVFTPHYTIENGKSNGKTWP